MIIDNKGRLFGKISIIDILVVFIVLGAIAGVGYKFTKAKVQSPIAGPKDNIEITFYTPEALEYAANSIEVGDMVKDGTQNVELGRVKEKKVDKAQSIATNAQGQYVPASRIGCVSLYITIEAKGKSNAQGVTIGTAEYYIGQRVDRLRVGDAAIDYTINVYNIKK